MKNAAKILSGRYVGHKSTRKRQILSEITTFQQKKSAGLRAPDDFGARSSSLIGLIANPALRLKWNVTGPHIRPILNWSITFGHMIKEKCLYRRCYCCYLCIASGWSPEYITFLASAPSKDHNFTNESQARNYSNPLFHTAAVCSQCEFRAIVSTCIGIYDKML